MIRHLCVVGVGLIGGSLARVLRATGYCKQVTGCGRRAEGLRTALSLGVIDDYHTEVASAVRGADMVVVAVPLGAMRDVLAAMSGHLDDGAVVTDVGSAKLSVLDAVRSAWGGVPGYFVPGHPIAGTERSGVEASFETLFRGRRVILTPVSTTSTSATNRVRLMWEATGASVETTDPEHHDAVLAATSHLPHVLAYTLVDTLGRMSEHAEIFRYAAGGFRDFTRIASSDPQMWHDICLANADAIVNALEHFEGHLHTALEAIRNGDSEAILALFERAKRLRDEHTAAGS